MSLRAVNAPRLLYIHKRWSLRPLRLSLAPFPPGMNSSQAQNSFPPVSSPCWPRDLRSAPLRQKCLRRTPLNRPLRGIITGDSGRLAAVGTAAPASFQRIIRGTLCLGPRQQTTNDSLPVRSRSPAFAGSLCSVPLGAGSRNSFCLRLRATRILFLLSFPLRPAPLLRHCFFVFSAAGQQPCTWRFTPRLVAATAAGVSSSALCSLRLRASGCVLPSRTAIPAVPPALHLLLLRAPGSPPASTSAPW